MLKVIFDSKSRNYFGTTLRNGFEMNISEWSRDTRGDINVPGYKNESTVVEAVEIDNVILMPAPKQSVVVPLITVAITDMNFDRFITSNNSGGHFLLHLSAQGADAYLGCPKHTTCTDGRVIYELKNPLRLSRFNFAFYNLSRQLTFNDDFIEFAITYSNPVTLTMLVEGSTCGAVGQVHNINNGDLISFVDFRSATRSFTSSEQLDATIYKENTYAATRISSVIITLPLDFTVLSTDSSRPSTTVLYVEKNRFFIPMKLHLSL